MIAPTAPSLLAELRRRGVTLAVRAGQLTFRPRSAVSSELLVQMSRCKAELIALVPPEGECTPSETPQGGTDKTDKSPDSPLLSVLSVPLACGAETVPPEVSGERSDEAPSNPLLPRVPSTSPGSTVMAEDEPGWDCAPIFAPPGPGPCRACGGRQRWRLRAGCPWVCSRCHPSLYALDQVEWLLPDHNSGGGAQ